jgi:type VI protein secretion system component VasF
MKQIIAITTKQDPRALARLNDVMTQAGQAANDAAARVAFDDHTARKAENTIRRKRADLALFEAFLQSAGVMNKNVQAAAYLMGKLREIRNSVNIRPELAKYFPKE